MLGNTVLKIVYRYNIIPYTVIIFDWHRLNLQSEIHTNTDIHDQAAIKSNIS